MADSSRYYSRQIAALGPEVFGKLQSQHVLLSGLRGVGIETAKNLILTGVAEVTLHDDAILTQEDLTFNFFISASDVGHKSRSQGSLPGLQSLNPSVKVHVKEGKLEEESLSAFTFLVLSESSASQACSLNQFCRTKNPQIGFVYCENWGAFGFVFSDFGPEFVTFDRTAEESKRYYISNITRDNPGIVTVYDRHFLQDGTYVTFKEVQGMEEINNTPPRPVRVVSPNSFSIEDTSGYSLYQREGIVENFKIPEKIRFKSLEFNLNKPAIHSDKPGRAEQLHVACKAIFEFQKKNGRLPANENEAFQVAQFAEAVNSSAKESNGLVLTFLNKELIKVVAANARWQHPVFSCYFGAVVSMEVIKHSGKYSPLVQSMYHDWYEEFPSNLFEYLNSQLRGHKGLLVGVGHLGSEISKLLTQLGVHELILQDKSKVKVSDRNLFFSKDSLGQSKAEVVASRLKDRNLKSVAFHSDFRVKQLKSHEWKQVNWVLSAVNNHHARTLIDKKCIWEEKTWIEGGIFNTFGLCSVYLPHITGSYCETVPPPEPCTSAEVIQFFPYAIEHCIEFAKEKFLFFFDESVKSFSSFLQNPAGFIGEMVEKDRFLKMHLFYDYLELLQHNSFEECLKYAKEKFLELFSENVQKLLNEFSAEARDSEGKHFWTGFKRIPAPVLFEASDEVHVAFVENFAALLAQVLQIEVVKKSAKEIKEHSVLRSHSPNDLQAILSTQTPNQYLEKVKSVEFDVDNNLHSLFIYNLSIIRARCYKILEIDRFSAEIIAGKINGSLPSTSSIVASQVVIELLKSSQNRCQNSVLNLGFNLCFEYEPISAKKNVSVDHDPELCAPKKAFPEGFTVWDKISVDGSLTIEEFLDLFREKYQLKINLITVGQSCIFNGISENSQNFGRRIEEFVADLDESIEVEISCQNMEGVEVVTPKIKYKLSG
jgi:ubiquitin-activating enzyme E1